MKKKLLILTNSYGGLYSFRREVVEALLSRDYYVGIAAPVGDNEAICNEFVKLGCQVSDLFFQRKSQNPFKALLLIIRYVKILRKYRPDVVLSYTIMPNLYGGIACQLCNVPQIANITGLGPAVENSGWLQRVTIVLYRLGMRRTNMVFFQNKANMDFCLRHKMVKRKNQLIPGSGVNLNYHAFQDYPSKEEPLRFIFISRLLKEKGVDEYLAAAYELKHKYPQIEFHILGNCEDNYSERIKQLQEEGIIIFHGRQSDVRPYLGQSCCTVHPSYYPEGMSNVLLESCAAGRPIITTDRPGCGEIVDDGINGFLVKQQNPNDLIKKIEMFICLPYEKRREMGLAARRKVEHEFDRNIVINAYLEAISVLEE